MLEREYIVPLRKEIQKVPEYRRANKAVRALKEFIAKHMKSENVNIGRFLNIKIWEKGIKNPPHKVSVKAIKDNDGKVTVELKEIPVMRPKINKKLARVERSEGTKSAEAETAETESSKKPKKAESSKKETEKKVSKEDSTKVSSSSNPEEKGNNKKTETKTSKEGSKEKITEKK